MILWCGMVLLLCVYTQILIWFCKGTSSALCKQAWQCKIIMVINCFFSAYQVHCQSSFLPWSRSKCAVQRYCQHCYHDIIVGIFLHDAYFHDFHGQISYCEYENCSGCTRAWQLGLAGAISDMCLMCVGGGGKWVKFTCMSTTCVFPRIVSEI